MVTKRSAILFLTQAYPDYPGAYRGIFVKNLADQVAKRGHPVIVVTPKIFHDSEKYESSGDVQVFRFFFPSGGKTLVAFKRIPVFRMLVYMFSSLLKSVGIMKRQGCEIIHVHWIHPNGIIGVVLKWLYHVPLVVHVRGTDFHTFAKRNRFFAFLTSFVLSHTDRILCTSGILRDGILMSFPEIDRENVIVVYNEVDTSLFHPIPEEEARKNLGIQEKGIHLLFIGNLVKEKGILDLLEVARKIYAGEPEKDVFLHVIGKGPLYSKLKERVKDGYEDKIFIHGAVPPREIPVWLNAANLLILPSDHEGMPNVVLEAFCCGIPVLATNVGDIHEFIRENVNGFLINPEKKTEELEKYLETLLNNPERLGVMKREMQRKISEGFSFPPASREVVEIYQTLLRSRKVKTHA